MLHTETRAHARRSLVRSALVVVGLVVAYSIVPLRGEHWWVGALVGVGAIVGTLPLTVKRLQVIRRSEQPVLVAIEAIVLLVSMLILGFAAVYYAIDADQTQMVGLETRLDSVYFTVTTLATVGYGDIHAAGQGARALATAQMLLNLAVLGLVVRVLARVARMSAGDLDQP